MRDDRLRVVHIMRAPFGGIRLHVLLLMEINEIDHWLVTDPTQEDAAFRERRRDPEFAAKLVPLSIQEAPGLSDFLALMKLFFNLRRIRPDILHGHGAKGGLYARVLAAILGARAVYSPHGGSLHRVFSPLRQTIYQSIERVLASLTDAFVFESKYSLDRYEESVRRLSGRGSLVPNGFHLPARSKRIEAKSNGRFILGAFGQLRQMKGQDLLIRATPLILRKGFDIEVRLFGDGPDRENFERLIGDLALRDRVKLIGDVANSIEKMSECDLIVQPSRFESFGYSAVEAMAAGVPLVASSVGGLREIVTDGVDGILVQKLSPEEFAERICFALSDSGLRSRLAIAAREKVECRYDADRMQRDILGIYRRI